MAGQGGGEGGMKGGGRIGGRQGLGPVMQFNLVHITGN